jgi:membrane associated rhomboid family serine protease
MTIPTWPRSTRAHPSLKFLLWIILGCALGGPILEKLGFPIQYYLGLSLSNLSHGFVWTLLTYPFTYLTINLLDLIFRLGVDLLLLWLFGSPLIDRIGPKHFFFLFFGATLFGGLAAAGALYQFNVPFFSGLSPVLLALFTSWAILHAKEQSPNPLSKFPWIVGILIGGTLILDLVAGRWPTFFADLSGAIFGYAFCITAEKAISSIRWLEPFERWVHRILERSHKPKTVSSDSKVIDFRTGQPILDDDQFMDAMLARITLYGEEILSPNERDRMRRISEKKARKK